MFYQESFYSDGALFAASKPLTFRSQGDKPLSAHLEDVPHWFTSPELRIPCPDDRKVQVVEDVARELRELRPSVEIDGIRATYPDGWALVRASNTGPNLTLRFESKTAEGLKAIDEEVMGILRKYVDVP